jgi:hypothetical protein
VNISEIYEREAEELSEKVRPWSSIMKQLRGKHYVQQEKKGLAHLPAYDIHIISPEPSCSHHHRRR